MTDVRAIARSIEHSLLRANATSAEIEALCAEAVSHGFYSVCVNPSRVRQACRLLGGSGVRVTTVVGFPLGAGRTKTRVQEALVALNEGADELDVVINVGATLDGDWAVVERDLGAVAAATAVTLPDGAHAVRKAILECCYLTDDTKARAGQLALDAGFEYLKTSTGFGPSGATVEDVLLLKRLADAHGSGARVKAAGGIRTLEHLTNMLHVGATLIGTSNGPSIMDEAIAAGS